MGANLFEVELHAEACMGIDLGTVALRGYVRFGLGEGFEKLHFEGVGFFFEKRLGQLDHACGVGDNLDGFNAGDVVKEPAATGVHELGMALHFHEGEGANAIDFCEGMMLVGVEEAIDVFRAAIENNLDIAIAGSPYVFEELIADFFCNRSQGIAELVEALA